MSRRAVSILALAVCLAAGRASGQDMPDPSLIHGRALPAPELANGTVTVRVVREAIGNNVAGQAVRLTVGSTERTATTDELGRAEFTGLPAGQATATATVDGEALTSQPFEVPTTGGLRVILVAGIARAAERKAAEEKEAAAAPAVKGVVVFGGNTRILAQFNSDNLDLYYVLEVLNGARTRVDTGAPIVITLPPGASGAAALDGSSRLASVSERAITISGPFPAGSTNVQVGFRLPYSGDQLRLQQQWPIALQQVTVGVEKVGNLSVASPQFTSVTDVRPDASSVYALGTGAALAAGSTLDVTISNLPHHSPVPRYVALSLAVGVVALGVWLSVSARGSRTDTRHALTRRRDELLGQLTNLDTKQRAGGAEDERYRSRRERLTGELEQIYGELDDGELTQVPRPTS